MWVFWVGHESNLTYHAWVLSVCINDAWDLIIILVTLYPLNSVYRWISLHVYGMGTGEHYIIMLQGNPACIDVPTLLTILFSVSWFHKPPNPADLFVSSYVTYVGHLIVVIFPCHCQLGCLESVKHCGNVVFFWTNDQMLWYDCINLRSKFQTFIQTLLFLLVLYCGTVYLQMLVLFYLTHF